METLTPQVFLFSHPIFRGITMFYPKSLARYCTIVAFCACALQAASAATTAANVPINAPGDAGAAGVATATVTGTAPSATVLKEFPVYQSARLQVLGGSVRGFGMLASYPAPGPRKVYFRRTTVVPASEPYHPICLLRVFDPAGHLVVCQEVTEQPTGTRETTLTLPKGAAGIWRVSFSGGRN
ncbi:MAG TPA: hypothetical protein VGM23_14270, partial [Armatimonadota bacterium]